MPSPRANFAFEELSLDDRVEVLDGLLVQLSADEVRAAVKDPECLGIVAEARLIGLTRSAELARYIRASDVRWLGTLVSDALLARLPQT